MHVCIVDTGGDRATASVNALSVSALILGQVGLRADGDDLVAGDGQGVCGCVRTKQPTARDHQVSRLSGGHGTNQEAANKSQVSHPHAAAFYSDVLSLGFLSVDPTKDLETEHCTRQRDEL